MPKIIEGKLNAEGKKFAIVASRYNDFITEKLVGGALVPGAFEIPGAIALAADRYDGFVALGCVVRGETTHYDYVCGESARGLMDLTVRERLAIGYGIITVENIEQARARAFTDRGDKGGDAAHACLSMVALARRWRQA